MGDDLFSGLGDMEYDTILGDVMNDPNNFGLSSTDLMSSTLDNGDVMNQIPIGFTVDQSDGSGKIVWTGEKWVTETGEPYGEGNSSFLSMLKDNKSWLMPLIAAGMSAYSTNDRNSQLQRQYEQQMQNYQNEKAAADAFMQRMMGGSMGLGNMGGVGIPTGSAGGGGSNINTTAFKPVQRTAQTPTLSGLSSIRR